MIIVSGIQRTGTSLLMEMLAAGAPGLAFVEKLADQDTEFLKALQPYYNENRFTVPGVRTNHDLAVFRTLKGRILKMIAVGITPSRPEAWATVSCFLVMTRDWRDQSMSFDALRLHKIKETHAGIADRVAFDDYYRDVVLPSGLHYAKEYITLVLYFIRHGLVGRVHFIAYEDLTQRPAEVQERVERICGIRLDPTRVAPCKQRDTSALREFTPGFFAFLDELQASLRSGRFNMPALNHWQRVLGKFLSEHYGCMRDKYKAIF